MLGLEKHQERFFAVKKGLREAAENIVQSVSVVWDSEKTPG